MIVELFGSPGAGKTYLINTLCGKDVNIKKKKGIQHTIFGTLAKKIVCLTPCAFSVRRKIYCNLDRNSYQYRYKPMTLRQTVNNISMLAGIYRYHKQDIYMDEGIVHRIIGLCINYNISMDTAVKIVSCMKQELALVTVYYLKVPIDICYQSIIARNRHSVEIDELKGDDLKQFLQYYQEYCDYVCQQCQFEIVDRENIGKIEVAR